MRHTILLVDDEPNMLKALQRVLHSEPYEVLTAGDAEQAARILAEAAVDLIICDEEMPGMRGTEFLVTVAREHPNTIRIMLTGHPTLPAALSAINEGRVYQFLTKPWNDIDLAICIRRALEQKELLDKSRELLAVTRQQSDLLDEARVLRRLRGLPGRDPAGAPTPAPSLSAQAILEELAREAARGRALLDELRNTPAD